MRQLTKFFRTLGNERRLGIVALLARGPRSVAGVAGMLRLSAKSTFKHLLKMEEAGLVDRQAHGREARYRLRRFAIERLAALERLCR